MQIYRSTKIAPNNPKGSMLQQASLHVMRQLGKRQSIIPRWSIFRSCSICNHQTVHSPLVFPVIFGFPHHWTRCSLPLYFLHLFAVSTHDCWFKEHCQEVWCIFLHTWTPSSTILSIVHCTRLYSIRISYWIILQHCFHMFSIVFHQFHQGRAVAGWHPHASRWSLDMTADTRFGHGKWQVHLQKCRDFGWFSLISISWFSVNQNGENNHNSTSKNCQQTMWIWCETGMCPIKRMVFDLMLSLRRSWR